MNFILIFFRHTITRDLVAINLTQRGVRYHWRASGCLFLHVNDIKRREKLKKEGDEVK